MEQKLLALSYLNCIDKEDACTVMNSAGTLTHSTLSGGWSEQKPVEEKSLTLCLQSP